MIIGSGFKRLEQRVTTALYDGRLSTKEAGFLQNILRKIELYRDRAFVSEDQANWLFTILTNFERGTTPSTKPRRRSRVAQLLCIRHAIKARNWTGFGAYSPVWTTNLWPRTKGPKLSTSAK